MVLRPSSLPHSPVKSRGVSPYRNGNSSHGKSLKNLNNNNMGLKTPIRSSSMSNGFNRGMSPARSLNGSRGRSPMRNAPVLIRSRGSE